MFAPAELFANPPVATEGAHIPNPRPLRGVTSAGKEIIYISSEESVASSNHELSSWDDVFAGVLRDLRIDHEEKRPKKTAAKKKVTVTGGASKKVGATRATSDAASKNGTLHFRQSNLEDFVVATDTLGLHNIGDKPQSSAVAVARSTGSARLKGPDFGATPSFIHEEAETEKPEAEKLIRKRSRAETATTTCLAKKIATGKPIEKKGSLRSLYTDVSPGCRK
ncbi:hypothetical protein HanRHA438_Chr06g0260641 [Helianthus annuus]|uniref:Uncharacterized protein n=1 Tax=Helianthus annuus TaxID=4232 RepID=A0A9K3NIR2_HELAN|nr:hypothetical protein HanXRQr2_Chr06g0251411 [Helianthus annuus]KAJ0559980.1 hypothetical protein HanHA300_Chr06g0206451 [Helianthus annuus]KAJ0566152.1 hypothetical protein HanIR_Chr06g0270581 [Helianthus annuus]KAJ0572970.1 hypothetical protein HanHA89_Chr06g0221611 [Helianthus annuus]KAJ0737412.1 hypothetical protein HanLR1_Chr06g0206711 [Helianthus annuus]